MRNYKLYLLSIFVGCFASLFCIPFRYLVGIISNIRPHLFKDSKDIFGIEIPYLSHIALLIAIYIVLLFVSLLIKYFPNIGGSGLPQTQALLYGRVVYKNPVKYLFVKFIGGILSLSSGLSLGREGTSVQMGSLTGYLTGNLFKVDKGKRRNLIAAGAGAGVSSAFTAPLSSSILILESLQKFTLPQTIICTLLAGGTASILSRLILPTNIYSLIPIVTPKAEEWKLILLFIIMGIYFAFLGKFFSIMLQKSKIWYNNLDNWKYAKYTKHTTFKVAFITIIIWVTGLFFPTMIGGDQTFLVSHATTSFSNILTLVALVVLISFFTIISNASGFPGGIFLPMMTVGGLAGKLFYEILKYLSGILNFADTLGIHKLHILTQIGSSAAGEYNLSGYFILIGMSAFFISVVRTPLTGFILISEMTGHYEVFFPSLIVGIMVFFLTQLLKVEPMNDLLYKFMIQAQVNEPITTTIYVDVSPDSYFCNKTTETLQLPKGCVITEIYRDKKVIPFTKDVSIYAGDQLSIVVQTDELEKVHQPLVSMGI